jgi:glycosyltransferase involved in cell wall biosynthesis
MSGSASGQFISVLMPAYNAERYVERAVRSVMAQTHTDWELIAIDDGSTDGTLPILRQLEAEDSRIRVMAHENVGMGAALNRAWPLCRGEWVARIDADDIMLPNRLSRQLEFVREHPHLLIASSLVEYIDEQDRPIGRNHSPFTSADKVAETTSADRVVGIHHPSVLVRRQAVLDVGGYRPAFWPCDDADLWNRILDRRPDALLVQPEHLVQYRIHDRSVCVSKAKLTQQRAEWVEACVAPRRQGKREPTWDEFMAVRRQASLWRRAHDVCREKARVLYKLAAIDYARRRYVRCMTELAGAALLEPSFVWERVSGGVRSRA